MLNATLKPLLISLLLTSVFALAARAQTTVVSADPLGNANAVYVLYSAAVDPVSATDTANYILINSSNLVAVSISSATLEAVCNNPSQTNVVLHLGAALEVATNY